MLSPHARLAFFSKLTIARWRQLRPHIHTADSVWDAPSEVFLRAGWSPDTVQAFCAWRQSFEVAEIEARLSRAGVRVVTIEDTAYPLRLKEIYDPPFALFVRGTLALGTVAVAVVGTRAMTPYGKQVTEEFVGSLARQGVTIVSGLALGIDGVAHRTALAAGGQTVAVLGTGVDDAHVYPATHRALAREIVAAGGAVVSEYPPGSRATQYSFPARNRIIAGLAEGVLVVEAGESSGALITANVAVESGREVFAVPQHITSATSFGPHALIKNGAHLVTSANDIFEILRIVPGSSASIASVPANLSRTEDAVYSQLSRVPLHVDAVIAASGLPGPAVMGALSLLEIKGYIKNNGNMMYIRNG